MKINLTLLKKILLTSRPPGKEHELISLILTYCNKIPNLTFKLDECNNLFIIKNTNNQRFVSCIISHMDMIVTHNGPRAMSIRNGEIRGYHKHNGTPCSLGADDGLGVCVALQLLKELPDIKVLFTTQEEIGGIGAYKACTGTWFFENVNFLIQPDRRGNSDLIIHTNGIDSGSDDFVKDISHITQKYGYKPAHGTFTDVGILAEKLKLSGVNVSVGYFQEHKSTEYTVIKDLENSLNYIYEILIHLNNHEPYKITVEYSDWWNYYGSDEQMNSACMSCLDFDCMNCKFYKFI